ncbi:hypothetical protein GX51_06228 [Blastomyces parvus]|uniref:Uncharacterized protein n=1 Tax=Blastomyces parvus TaxID=2060905 RepID=A0A2B7WSK7_9EURO|nr:hypothetical protein GX51_06228 [Blastomyces parvus]
MSEIIPLVVLDSDDEDELQITSVSVCAQNRITSDPGCSQGDSNPSNCQQRGNSFAANGVDGQQVTATGQTQGATHLLSPSTAEWLLQSTIPIERSPYFLPPSPSPTISPSAAGNPGEKNQAASPYPAPALADISVASPGQGTRAQHASSSLQFPNQFFTDMADAIAHVFPYGELARKYKCSVDQVNRALIAVVLDPLMKSNGELESCRDSNEREEDGEHGQTCAEEPWNSPNVLISKWNKRHQEMVSELQRESEWKGLPMEFEQILVAASGNAEAYWKARNAAFDAYKAFQDTRKKERAGAGVAERESGHQNLQQQLEDVIGAAEPESQVSRTETETAAGAALSLHEKEIPEDASSASSRKRARSSETFDGTDAAAHSTSSTATPPVLYQLYSTPPSKKAKTNAYLSTSTQTTPGESIAQTSSLCHPNPKRPAATDRSSDSDTYTLGKFPYNRRNNTDDNPPPTPSPPSSTSSTGSPQSPTAQTPTPLPRSRSLPNNHSHTTANTLTNPEPETSPSRPNLFTRSTHRHAVTIDKFGNYQRENQNQQTNQYSPPTAYNNRSNRNRDNPLLPRPDDLLRRPHARTQREPTDSGDEGDVYDPYYHARADKTTRVFTEGLWGELFGGFGMGEGNGKGKGKGGQEEGGERALMGLEFGLAQIEVSGKGEGMGRMLGDFGGDVNGEGRAVGVGGGSGGEGEDGDAGDDYGYDDYYEGHGILGSA